jgi:hypothetical protein
VAACEVRGSDTSVVASLEVLLDDQPIHGMRGVERSLGPRRWAIVIDPRELSSGTTAVEGLCESWGGGQGLLLPAAVSENIEILEPFGHLAQSADLDTLTALGSPNDGRRFADRVTSARVVEPLLPVLASQGEGREQWLIVRVPEVQPGDPWYVALGDIWDVATKT